MSKTAEAPEVDRSEVLRVYAEQGADPAAALAGVSKRTVQRWATAEGVASGYTAPILRECPSSASYVRGCRCDGCCEANRIQQKEVKARRVAYYQKHGTKRNGEPIPHGTSGYSNWDCRCATCKTAWSNYLKDHRGG